MNTATQDRDTSDWRNLIAACAAICVFGLAFGMTYPLLSLILESRGTSTNMIGVNAAMMPIGILLFSSVIPVAVKRFGARKVAMLAALLTAVLIMGYKVFDTLEAWFVLRLLQGMTISTLFVLSEAWIVGSSAHQHRGRVVAIYASTLSASFAIGPALVGWIGIHGWLPFILGSIVILLGIIPLWLVREDETAQPEETKTSGIFAFAPKAPLLLAAVGAFAIFDAGSLALLPVYGVQSGLSIGTAAAALTALIAGNIILQFPLGWLADKFPRRLVLAGCALVCAITLCFLPFTVATLWMWPVLVIAGAAGYGVYTIALTSLGDRFSGIELVNGSAAFAVMWGVGALLGAVSSGWAMNGFGPHGLPIFFAVVYGLLTAGLLVRSRFVGQQSDHG